MILFWLLAAAMLLVILAILLPPLFATPKRDGEGVERDQLNIALYRDQLKELETEHARGEIDAVQLERARIELKRELLDEVDEDAQTVAAGSRGVWVTGLVVALAIPLLAVGLYMQLGETELLTDAGQAALVSPQQEAHPNAEVDAMIEALAAKLQQAPDNLEGWEMLGRTLIALQRYAEAADAYAQVYRLAGDDPDVMIDYAEALAMRIGGEMLGDPLELIDMALKRQPTHEKGLWLAGIAAYQNRDMRGALNHWETLGLIIGTDNPNRSVLDSLMAEARAELGITAPPVAAAPKAAAPTADVAATAIQVTVDIDPALAARVTPGDVLFIFARAASGPRVPLAIVRTTAAELPLTVTLDDSLAMAPTFRLSGFDVVNIGARISKSGNATPQPGDLRGGYDGVRVGVDRKIAVTISEVL